MIGVGGPILESVTPVLEWIAPFVPGEVFPYFFTMEMFQRALIATLLVTVIAGILGTYLLVQNLALIGDGLAHVSFGGVAVGIVLGATSPLMYALVFSIISAVLIHEMQARNMLSGDASIAIFLTGMLALGLVLLRLFGGGITTDIEGYLFGNLLLIDEDSFDLIVFLSLSSMVLIGFLRNALLAVAVDPVAARIQGLPVRNIGLLFSVITAAVVVSMVQVVGTLLVTALLVTPAATAKLVGGSFRSCMLWTQVFGIGSVMLGLYFSAEHDTGSGTMIALLAAVVFAIVAVSKVVSEGVFRHDDNMN
ncbi:MAG: metal ABC transporter permease [Candidatus Thermoplasmatota archaeon]|nr:metal ABC transporter permease [Candidatus Thermoplasmatota archaeon]GIR76992.1 MAG: manganese ABC transporter permease [Candidatus Poseidoniales archaeon]MEC7350299.1 metal ABC transporter permease [Candidatus Thermoplasmatota archaeon]MEC7443640.1 metal ABC transporter permease [Candidatus Thermoplasmatota archaeon]MEC7504737.1 metal ABC transporter permease [Candidatus Thermoplasmatota archaeon]|tara:strand:- start:197 stop:1117 length:921 start_codon:yes stop_codon:yes gene_type:complete